MVQLDGDPATVGECKLIPGSWAEPQLALKVTDIRRVTR